MHMGKTISFVKGKGSISHNNRDFIAENVDRNRTAWNKVLQYDKFFNVKGLVEEFKEFVRPKSIKDRMEAKQKVVEKQKCEQVVNSTARREKDIAI